MSDIRKEKIPWREKEPWLKVLMTQRIQSVHVPAEERSCPDGVCTVNRPKTEVGASQIRNGDR